MAPQVSSATTDLGPMTLLTEPAVVTSACPWSCALRRNPIRCHPTTEPTVDASIRVWLPPTSTHVALATGFEPATLRSTGGHSGHLSYTSMRADDGNRTRVTSLEDWDSTIELHRHVELRISHQLHPTLAVQCICTHPLDHSTVYPPGTPCRTFPAGHQTF